MGGSEEEQEGGERDGRARGGRATHSITAAHSSKMLPALAHFTAEKAKLKDRFKAFLLRRHQETTSTCIQAVSMHAIAVH
jgi:hypothetical protein